MQDNFKVVIGYIRNWPSVAQCVHPLNIASNMHLAALLAGTNFCLGGEQMRFGSGDGAKKCT